MKISLIAAIGTHREIGLNNRLLWQLPADLKNFKELTYGHFIVMGSRTFSSIGKALPGRTNLVLSRRGIADTPGVVVVNSLALAWRLAQENNERELFVIGGGEIYAETLPYAHCLYLSTVDYSGKADAYFPEFGQYPWVKSHERHYAAEGDFPAWKYQILHKEPELKF